MRLQQQVGLRLKALREKKGLSQEALAAACGLHRTYIGLIERGQRSLSISTVEQIAETLEISPAELFQQAEIGPVPVRAKARKEAMTLQRLSLTVAAIRQVLIDAKLVDQKRFDKLLKETDSL